MRRFLLAPLGALLAHALYSPLAFADENLFDKPLEDLLEIRVTTASKQAESIDKSPAVLSIVTEKEIAAYGALTLADVLDRVTSVYVVGTLPLPRGMLSIRGDVTSQQNNHVLILLNGRPMRDSIYSGLNEEIYTAFPVAAIKQIEVIRGPGSVLYGTNAFVGVVNIITKDARDNTIEPTIRVGSFGGEQVSAFAAHRFGELELSGSVNYFHDNGWNFTATDQSSVTRTEPWYTHTAGGTLLAHYRKLTLNAYLGSEELPFMSISAYSPLWTLSGTHRAFRATVDLGYEDDLTSTWKQTVNVTYNRLGTSDLIPGSTNEATSNDALVEWTHYLKLLANLEGLAGLVYTKQTGSGTNQETGLALLPFYNDDLYSAYAQLSYQALSNLRFIVGGQAIQVPDNSLNVVPRAAAIYTFTPEVGVKALFSNAFRAPSESERHLSLISLGKVLNVGDPGLQSERIGTLDLQIFYQTKGWQASLTYFNSRQLGLIAEEPINGVSRYVNVADETTQGAELEGKVIVSSRWSVQGNLTYQTSLSDAGVVDDGHVPNVMAKIGAIYHPWEALSIGVFNSFYAAPKQVDNSDGSTLDVNPKADYYNYLSANLTFNLSQALELKAFPETEIQLTAFNLLDQSVYYPEYVYGVINTFPGRPGRSVYGSVSMKF